MPRPIKEPSTSRWVSNRNRGSQFTLRARMPMSTVPLSRYLQRRYGYVPPFIATIGLNDNLWVVSLDCVCNDKTCRARKIRHAIGATFNNLLSQVKHATSSSPLPLASKYRINLLVSAKIISPIHSTEQDMLLRRLGEHCEVHLFPWHQYRQW